MKGSQSQKCKLQAVLSYPKLLEEYYDIDNIMIHILYNFKVIVILETIILDGPNPPVDSKWSPLIHMSHVPKEESRVTKAY